MSAIIFAALSGCFVVLQTGLNKNISESWGLTSALLLNGVTFLIFNLVWFAFVWYQPRTVGPVHALQGHMSDFRLWWVLPGLFGFLLVLGVTAAIKDIGAVQTFVISISAQIACSFLWDLVVEGRELSMMRVAGVIVTLAGAFLTVR